MRDLEFFLQMDHISMHILLSRESRADVFPASLGKFAVEDKMIPGFQHIIFTHDAVIGGNMELPLLKHGSSVNSINEQEPEEEFMLQLAAAFPQPFDGVWNVKVVNLSLIRPSRYELLFLPYI